jgi:hypothetical protein
MKHRCVSGRQNRTAFGGGVRVKVDGVMGSATAWDEGVIAERIALNQSTFREANERIEAVAARGGIRRVPFLCECSELECTVLVSLSLDEYEEIRSRGDRFFVTKGHEVQVVEGIEVAQVVERRDRFSTMEKVGRAGEVARAEDPRRGASNG